MIVLVEGCDCTGKTTLAKALSEDLGIAYVHHSVPPAERIFDYFRYQLDEHIREHEHFVLDRFHLSNAAYGTRFGAGVMNPVEWQAIDWQLAKRGAMLILMLDNPFEIAARIAAERAGHLESGMDASELGELQNRFLGLYDRTRIYSKLSFKLTSFMENGEKSPHYASLLGRLRGQIALDEVLAA